MAKKRLHVLYSGIVQGVGFRFTAERIAQSHGLTGWVRNIPDGRVEVLLEGEEAAINKFLKGIKTSFPQRYIDDVDVEWSAAKGEFSGFNIKFY